jgi:hypothetical protein
LRLHGPERVSGSAAAPGVLQCSLAAVGHRRPVAQEMKKKVYPRRPALDALLDVERLVLRR